MIYGAGRNKREDIGYTPEEIQGEKRRKDNIIFKVQEIQTN